ncbi:hypothetical protein [Glycomyces buryatensis]|uniref:DUF998 domain-containing protein n=1 Tax=Glycomyces buryatensis TaxID=2570927 RepID=A0A4S8QEN2_9ACTN|nr:hypothetical protein [Glycomyces buryatensis]THV43063.1 hypothetical protein FAB82_03145 [Glycomyces buryatensis]
MDIGWRQWILGLLTAVGVAAALAFLQPLQTHWMGVFNWDTTFCGSSDAGDEKSVISSWTSMWTISAVILGALAGQRAASRRSTDEQPDLTPQLRVGLLAAAAIGSLTIVPALLSLTSVAMEAAAEQDYHSPCLTASAAVLVAAPPLAALGSYAITRSAPRAFLATISVYLLMCVSVLEWM